MIEQNGQAITTVSAPVAASCSIALLADALPGFVLLEQQAAAGAAAERVGLRPLGLGDGGADAREQRARLVDVVRA